ncbi:MAG: AAA family ATPase [Oscillospiraceae bacterium]|nr:AAA family ATPase [Oscillospiraceae bacterium]
MFSYAAGLFMMVTGLVFGYTLSDHMPYIRHMVLNRKAASEHETVEKRIVGNRKLNSDLGSCAEMFNSRVGKTFLVLGEPGMGKSTSAQSLANRIGSYYFKLDAVSCDPEVVSDTFEVAKQLSEKNKEPVTIIIEDIDNIASERRNEVAIMSLLESVQEDRSTKLAVVCTASDASELTRLKRRFSKTCEILPPQTKSEIREIFDYQLSQMKHKLSQEEIESWVEVFRYSDFPHIKELIIGAKQIALYKRESAIIRDKDMERSYLDISCGEKTDDEPSAEDLKRTSIHEASHALLAWFSGRDVSKVIISPRTRAAGATFSRRREGCSSCLLQSEFCFEIIICVAGRAGEQVYFEECSIGSASDFKKATRIIELGIGKYAVSEVAGMATKEKDDRICEVFIEKFYSVAKEIIASYPEFIKRVSDLLLEKHKIDAKEFEKIASEYNREEKYAEVRSEILKFLNKGNGCSDQSESSSNEMEGDSSVEEEVLAS